MIVLTTYVFCQTEQTVGIFGAKTSFSGEESVFLPSQLHRLLIEMVITSLSNHTPFIKDIYFFIYITGR